MKLRDKIRDVILNFFRRWWIVNRLYHYEQKRDFWVDESQFITYLQGVDYIEYLQDVDKERLIKGTWVFPFNNPPKTEVEINAFQKKMRFLIQECVGERLHYIERLHEPNGENKAWIHISSRGNEMYSVSYLIFRFIAIVIPIISLIISIIAILK